MRLLADEFSDWEKAGIKLGAQLSLRELRWGAFPGLSWLTRLLDGLALWAGVQFDANLLLFRKALLTLEGVVADLSHSDKKGSQAVLDAVVTSSFLDRLLTEWPKRFWAPFDSKSCTTHLSNADLLSLAWSGTAAFTRRWSELSFDFFAKA